MNCPFCGSTEVIRQTKGTFQFDGYYCVNCGRKIPEISEEEVISTLEKCFPGIVIKYAS